MPKPKQYLFLDSPMACQLFLNGSSQLWNQLGSQQKNFVYVSQTNWTQGYYWFYIYVLNEIFPTKIKDFSLFTEYVEHSKHYHHIYLSPDMAVFSDFPKHIKLDSQGKLNSEDGIVISWAYQGRQIMSGVQVPFSRHSPVTWKKLTPLLKELL